MIVSTLLLAMNFAPPFWLTDCLEVKLSVDSSTILLGDSLSCKTQFRNKGDIGVGLFGEQSIANGNIKLMASQEGGEWKDLIGPVHGPCGSPGSRWLEPNEKVVALDRVRSARGDLLFAKVGKLKLKAVVRVPVGEVESNEVEIAIGPRDPATVELLRRYLKDQAKIGGPKPKDPLTPEELDIVQNISDGNLGATAKCTRAVEKFLADEKTKINRQSIAKLLAGEGIKDNPVRSLQARHLLAEWCRKRKDWDSLTEVLDSSPEWTFELDSHLHEMRNAQRLTIPPRLVVPPSMP